MLCQSSAISLNVHNDNEGFCLSMSLHNRELQLANPSWSGLHVYSHFNGQLTGHWHPTSNTTYCRRSHPTPCRLRSPNVSWIPWWRAGETTLCQHGAPAAAPVRLWQQPQRGACHVVGLRGGRCSTPGKLCKDETCGWCLEETWWTEEGATLANSWKFRTSWQEAHKRTRKQHGKETLPLRLLPCFTDGLQTRFEVRTATYRIGMCNSTTSDINSNFVLSSFQTWIHVTFVVVFKKQ